MPIQIDDYIEKEYRKIYVNHWKFMNKEYIYKAINKYHRKKIEQIPNIESLKKMYMIN
jgi:predicted nuclease of restriction endonuclease-like RecB superfamily